MSLNSELIKGGIGFVGATTAMGAVYDVAASNADQEYSSVGKSAALGAGVGAVAYGLGAGLVKSGEYLGKNNFANGKRLAEGLGDIALKASAGVGEIAIGAGKGVIQGGAGLAVGVGDSIANNFLTINPKNNNIFGGLSLNKKGKWAAGIIGVGMAIAGAMDTQNEIRKGSMSGVMTSTPQYDAQWSSMDNYQQRSAETYGAGGDLVFALNANRRGRRY